MLALLLCFIVLFSLDSCLFDHRSLREIETNATVPDGTADDTTDSVFEEEKSNATSHTNIIAMQMYEAAINDEICVFDEHLGETTLKSLRFPSNNARLDECKLHMKAILDVDRDGINEYVIQSPNQEYIILRYYNGKVYSYWLDVCDIYNFKTDGT